MSNLIRKQLYLTIEQENRLKEKAKKLGRTQAELVREALDNHTYAVEHSQRNINKWKDEVEFIEKKRMQKKGPKQKRSWKREDAYE